MQVNVADVSAVKKRIEVELSPEQVRTELDRAYDRIRHRVRIKGFRPGKVPRPVLERYFGAQVRDEVTAELISRSYRDAVAERGLNVVAEPKIDDFEAASGEHGFRFTAIVEVRPRVEVRERAGLEVSRVRPQVDEKEVEANLERLREMHAQMAAIEDRDEVAKGDLVLVDYTAIVNGRPLPAASAKGRVIEVGSGALPGEFEEQLVGMKRGETRRVDMSFPASHPNPSLAGKKVAFRVLVEQLGRKELPVLDDEFARDCGDTGSLEELRGKIRSELLEESERMAERAMKNQLIERLVEKNPLDIPEGMVKSRLDAMLREVGLPPGGSEKLDAATGEKIEQLRSKLRPQAERDVRSALLLEEVARQEGMEVSEKDVRKRMALYVADGEAKAGMAEKLFENASLREQIRTQLLREGALERLMAQARIIEAQED